MCLAFYFVNSFRTNSINSLSLLMSLPTKKNINQSSFRLDTKGTGIDDTSIISRRRAPELAPVSGCLSLIFNACLSFLLIASLPLNVLAEANSSSASSQKKTDLKESFSTGDSNDPVYIKSDTLTLDSKSRVFTYEDNVEVVRGEVSITSDRVIGTYDENNQLQKVVCEDNVVVTKGQTLRASANRAVYTLSKKTIELTEAPELARDANVLFADKITIYVEEDRSEAEGNVRVKVIKPEDDGNELPTQKVLKAKKKPSGNDQSESDSFE
jgi:lipopolysaccharide export system protein LptA